MGVACLMCQHSTVLHGELFYDPMHPDVSVQCGIDQKVIQINGVDTTECNDMYPCKWARKDLGKVCDTIWSTYHRTM